MKKCRKCEINKTEDLFYKNKYYKDGYSTICKSCECLYKNTIGRNKQLKTRYGIDTSEYNQILAKQNNCCAICNTHISKLSKNLAVDHDHSTLKVRGLLCFNCNSGLGRFKDNPEFLKIAISYLMRSIDLQDTFSEMSPIASNRL